MADTNSILDRLPALGKLSQYKGTTLILSGIAPKGGGDFALVEAHSIQVTNEDDRLDAVLQEIKKRLDSGSGGGSGSSENGATFYPTVSEDGWLSWTNDKELEDPTPVNIKGTGIDRIVLVYSDDEYSEYRIYFTDNSYFDYVVNNGTPGTPGAPGEDGKTPFVNDGYWYIGDQNTGIKAQGDTGNGIDYIQAIDAVEGYTTLEIYMTKGPTQTVHIPNGAPGTPGTPGAPGVPGAPGEDGKTPFVNDGYWYIGDQNTGIKAQGDTGNGIDYIQTIDAVEGYTVLEIYLTDGTVKTVYIPNGKDGQDGQDAVSPSVSVDKVGKTTTITITDKDGTHTATIKDGMDGSGEGKVLERVELQRPYVYTECKFLSIVQEYPLFPVYRKSDAVFNDARYKARIPLFCRWYQNNSFSLDLDSPSGYVGALTISKYSGSIEIEYDYTTIVYSGGGSDISFCFDDNNDLLLLIMGADNNVISEISMRDVFGSRYSYLIQYYIKNSSPSTEFADIYRIFNTDGTSIPMNIIPPIM